MLNIEWEMQIALLIRINEWEGILGFHLGNVAGQVWRSKSIYHQITKSSNRFIILENHETRILNSLLLLFKLKLWAG